MFQIIYPSIAIALFGIVLTLIFVLNKNYVKEPYSLKRYFPFEAFQRLPVKARLSLLSLVALDIAIMAESYIVTFFELPNQLGQFTAIALALSAFFLIFVYMIDLNDYRKHLILNVVFFMLTIGGMFLAALTSILGRNSLTVFNLPIGIIMGSIALIALVSLFLPKLKNWMYLEKTEVDGKTMYVRPKVSILSLFEWIFILIHVLNMVLMLINNIIYY